jgi:hypothetical protein
MAPILVLGPSVILAEIAPHLARIENRAVAAQRKRLRTRRFSTGTLRRLIGVWYESFESARRGQSLGRGVKSKATLGLTTALAAALLVLCGALLITPVAIMGILGPASVGIAVPSVSAIQDRVRAAGVARPYRLLPDSSISALDAGRALYTLSEMGRTSPRPAYVRPPAREILEPLLPREGNPFGDLNSSDSSLGRVLRLARSGFSGEQAAYLEKVAAHPAFEELAVLARAPGLDLFGAEYVLPLPDSLPPWELQVPRVTPLRQVAYAAWAKAAFQLSQGQTREAETTLREALSYGLLLVDEGSTLMEDLIGTVLTYIGLAGLEDLYEVTGRDAEVRAIRTAREGARRAGEELGLTRSGNWSAELPANDLAGLRRAIIQITRDTTLIRGFRWEMAASLPHVACSNVRELLFGPSDEIVAAFRAAREQLTRYPSDVQIFDFLWSQYDRGVRAPPTGFVLRFGQAGAELAGALFGNNRLASCFSHVSAIVMR